MSKALSREIVTLEAARENGRMKICAYEKFAEDQKTLRHHEFMEYSEIELNKMCSVVIDILNRANKKWRDSGTALHDLKTTGQILYDLLLTNQVKKRLAATRAENLILDIDERLVHIPWELLFDGREFLCHRFNMGRIVSTGQRTSDAPVRKTAVPLRMLIVADPRGDLESSYKEGDRLTEELDGNRESVEIDLRSSPVEKKFLKGVIRSYDILHYAGHADYDTTDPSNSGFLLHDGKLKASDVISMIGETPLPSLVFSNACKSGHTGTDRKRHDYEDEIYGLANAFLLAGVQHYIGTFWDILDEPGLYFSIDFYKEMMSGSMIGEAMRKARLKSVERYGRDTVVWASYMLYGDPAVRYHDTGVPVDEDRERSGSIRQETRKEETVAGTRSAPEEIVFRKQNRKWPVAGSLLLLAAALLVFFFAGKATKNNTLVRETMIYKQDPAAEKRERIDKLVASLSSPGVVDRAVKTGNASNGHISRVPTMVFLNIKEAGISEIDRDFIFDKTIEYLHSSGRVDVVERETLDALLGELQLSHSGLTDLSTALKVGRLLSARLIAVGNILKEENVWQINLRFIESETSSVRAALTETMRSKGKDAVAERLGKGIIEKIRREFPLRGKILSAGEDDVVMDIGSRDGISAGLLMNVIFDTDGTVTEVGRLKVVTVRKDTSVGRIITGGDEIREGFSVEEIL